MRALVVALLLAACGSSSRHGVELVVGAYTAPREAFEEAIIPAFERAHPGVTVRASYLGSGAQARAVVEGFEADVVVLALQPDVDKIVKAKLTDDAGQIVTRTAVVLAVRKGNPKGLATFADLARDGLEVLTPNPRTSGGAMWNLLAIWAAGGADLVGAVLRNVVVMDKGARESLINFERGIGDAAITYEQEVVAARLAGRDYDDVVPPRTLMVDIPAAVVTVNADRHHTTELARAFVDFVKSPDGQALLAKYGFRPPDAKLPCAIEIGDLGGWPEASKLFARGGPMLKLLEDGP